MSKAPIADEVVESDVLVIGGGLAGSWAAIRARQAGASVAVMEKTVTKTSGDAYAGLDQLSNIAHPKLNRTTPEEYVEARIKGYEGLVDPRLMLITATEMTDAVFELERLGVQIREEDGELKFMPGRLHGMYSEIAESEWKRPGDWLLLRGADMKAKLAAEVKRLGAKIYERTTLTSLLKADGKIVGATGFNVRTGKFVVFKAKSTVLASGGCHRLYWHPYGTSPNNLFILFSNSMNSGDGAAAAYRAGAKLANMEFTYGHTLAAGLPWGVSVWYFCTPKNSKGEGLVEKYGKDSRFTESPTERGLSQVSMMWQERNEIMTFDTTGLDDQAQRYWEFMRANERPGGLKILQARGGLAAYPFQARTWTCGVVRNLGGLAINEYGGTSLEGLYAAGDAQAGGPLAGTGTSFAWGRRSGKYAAERALDFGDVKLDEEQVLRERERVMAPLSRRDGIFPLDAEDVIRKIVWEYVGYEKSEAKLKRCVELLDEAEQHMLPKLGAENPHEAWRALEVQSILEIGRIHARAARIRKESRLIPWHNRVDYPERDDVNWKRSVTLWKDGSDIDHTVTDPEWNWAWR